MSSMQMFPFERNRYYQGKMLTSADFQAEQLYMNDKRRFLNKMMFGAGVIYGMSVFNLDDLSILVESGAAMDDLGREIVIDSSVVRKLSAISGFEELTEDRISLCIRYKEEEIHPVYSMHQQEQEYEYNRISEGYELFLKNTAELENRYAMETEFLLHNELFCNGDYQVQVWIPAMAVTGRQVRLSLKITKKSPEAKKISLWGVFQLPMFMTGNHGQEIVLEGKALSLREGEQVSQDYWIQVEATETEECSIILKPDTFRIEIQEEAQEASPKIQLKLRLVNQEPEELVQTELSRNSLEMQNMGVEKDYVRLADFDMVHTETAYIINEIKEKGVKKYISAPSKTAEASRYLSYYKQEDEMQKLTFSDKALVQEQISKNKPVTRISRGTIELPLEPNMKKGEICYSEEIIHGLGLGNVYVAVGTEFLNDNTTVYGDAAFFKKNQEEFTNLQTAVQVFHNHGSFQVAAKLTGEQNTIVAALNWIAIRFSKAPKEPIQQEGPAPGIVAVTPTAIMGLKEKYYFNVRFQQMQPCRLSYEMSEEGTGTVGQDGMYTAPGREGIFEIQIACAGEPEIVTYAYAVVKKNPGSPDRT